MIRSFLATIAMVGVCACGHVRPPAFPAPAALAGCGTAVRMVVLGDSLARGIGASDAAHSFVGLLAAHVRRDRRVRIVDYGMPGANASDIARREVPPLRPGPCDLVIVIAGANDVQQFHTPGQFAGDYLRLIRAVRERDPRAGLVLLGLPQISQSRIIPGIFKAPIGYLSDRDNASIRDVAGRYRAGFVDLYALSLAHATGTGKLIGPDGLHPNDRGYALMAAAAFPAVDAALASPAEEGETP
jgi:acyl-CoA thioesterase-1